MPIWLFWTFCLVPIPVANSKNQRSDALAYDGLEVPLKTVLIKPPYKHSEVINGNGEDEDEYQQQMVYQFVRELIDQYNTIGAALYDVDQTEMIRATGWQKFSAKNIDELVDGIKNIKLLEADKKAKNVRQELMENFEISKSIDQPEMADLLHKLHKSINVLVGSINNGILEHEYKSVEKEIVEAVIMLANDWDISLNEIMPLENRQKIDQKSILEELATLWHQFKSEEGDDSDQNSEENRQNGQRNKRMLQLIMDFSSDGIDGLANLKSQKKSRRRRRRRRDSAKGAAIAIFVILLVLLALFCAKHYIKKCAESKHNEGDNDIESGSRTVSEMEPETRENTAPAGRDGTHGKKKRRPKSRLPRQHSQSRQPLHHFDHSSSRGDPNRGNAAQFPNINDQLYYSTTHHAEQQNGLPPRDSMYHADQETFERNNRQRAHFSYYYGPGNYAHEDSD